MVSLTGVEDDKDFRGKDMNYARLAAVLIGAFTFNMPASAHHPGADLDKIMGSKEQFFQAIDSQAPPSNCPTPTEIS